jgi:hypothetical protein
MLHLCLHSPIHLPVMLLLLLNATSAFGGMQRRLQYGTAIMNDELVGVCEEDNAVPMLPSVRLAGSRTQCVLPSLASSEVCSFFLRPSRVFSAPSMREQCSCRVCLSSLPADMPSRTPGSPHSAMAYTEDSMRSKKVGGGEIIRQCPKFSFVCFSFPRGFPFSVPITVSHSIRFRLSPSALL